MAMPAFFYVILSLNSVYALAPVIIIFILIAAAAGFNRGFDLFAMFGFAEALGLSRGFGAGGAGKGLARKPYSAVTAKSPALTPGIGGGIKGFGKTFGMTAAARIKLQRQAGVNLFGRTMGTAKFDKSGKPLPLIQQKKLGILESTALKAAPGAVAAGLAAAGTSQSSTAVRMSVNQSVVVQHSNRVKEARQLAREKRIEALRSQQASGQIGGQFAAEQISDIQAKMAAASAKKAYTPRSFDEAARNAVRRDVEKDMRDKFDERADIHLKFHQKYSSWGSNWASRTYEPYIPNLLSKSKMDDLLLKKVEELRRDIEKNDQALEKAKTEVGLHPQSAMAKEELRRLERERKDLRVRRRKELQEVEDRVNALGSAQKPVIASASASMPMAVSFFKGFSEQYFRPGRRHTPNEEFNQLFNRPQKPTDFIGPVQPQSGPATLGSFYREYTKKNWNSLYRRPRIPKP